jgi:hypothetical protein
MNEIFISLDKTKYSMHVLGSGPLCGKRNGFN